MDERTLISKLKWLKGEILALKTAHRKGLGTANFASATGSLVYTTVSGNDQYLKITVKFADSIAESPVAQCYISNAQYFEQNDIKWDASTHTVTFLYRCYITNISLVVDCKVIATAAIENIIMEATDPYGTI